MKALFWKEAANRSPIPSPSPVSKTPHGVEYSGCFFLDHEVEPEKIETKFEDGVFRIFTPFKGWEYWDRLREGFMGRPVIKG